MHELHERREPDADRAADRAEHDGFEEERGQHGAAPVAEGAQRPDLGDAVRHRGIHRDHRADHRADGEDDREREAEIADELGKRLRLVFVEHALALHVEREPRVGLQPRLDRVQRAAVDEPRDDRR